MLISELSCTTSRLARRVCEQRSWKLFTTGTALPGMTRRLADWFGFHGLRLIFIRAAEAGLCSALLGHPEIRLNSVVAPLKGAKSCKSRSGNSTGELSVNCEEESDTVINIYHMRASKDVSHARICWNSPTDGSTGLSSLSCGGSVLAEGSIGGVGVDL